MVGHAMASGEQIVIGITPAIERRLKTDRAVSTAQN
jgi:hypothetical protein